MERVVSDSCFKVPDAPPTGTWNKPFNLIKANPTQGFLQNCTSRFRWVFPGNLSVNNGLNDSDCVFAVLPQNESIGWQYGENQGIQLTFANGTFVTFDTPATFCLWSNFTYSDYLGYAAFTFQDSELGENDQFVGLTRDVSNVDGYSAVVWKQKRSNGALRQFTFASPYNTPNPANASETIPTMTWYTYNFKKKIHAAPPRSSSFWDLPSVCYPGSPTLFPMTSTFPFGWQQMFSIDPTGRLAFITSSTLP